MNKVSAFDRSGTHNQGAPRSSIALRIIWRNPKKTGICSNIGKQLAIGQGIRIRIVDASNLEETAALDVPMSIPFGLTWMKDGQTLWGAGALFAVNGLTIPATAQPTLNGTVTLANNVYLRSVSINGGAALILGLLPSTLIELCRLSV